jgi:putative FmdB family regulatory protein
MPIYEYECEQCSLRFELRRSFDGRSEVVCPQCGGSARRIFSPVPIIFKGSGFYITDSREEGTAKAKTGSSSGEVKEGGAKEIPSSNETSAPS